MTSEFSNAAICYVFFLAPLPCCVVSYSLYTKWFYFKMAVTLGYIKCFFCIKAITWTDSSTPINFCGNSILSPVLGSFLCYLEHLAANNALEIDRICAFEG